jgi:hypothetical protein
LEIRILGLCGKFWKSYGNSGSPSCLYEPCAGAISMKLGMIILWASHPVVFFYFRDLTYFLASWQTPNFAILKLMVVGRMTKFLE